MSFSSVLPTPQILLKSGAAAAPPPPPLVSSDAAVGADALTALLATFAVADAAAATDAASPVVAAVRPLPEVGRGGELVAEHPVRLPPEVDVGRPLDLLVRAGPKVFERVLRYVKREDVILPDDQNELVYAWRDVVEGLRRGRKGMQLAKPEALEDYDRYAQRLEELARAMPVVKEDDWVYAEHLNLHLRALRAMIEMRRWLANQVFPELPGIAIPADRAEFLLLFVWEKGSGDVVLSADWNAVRQALSALHLQVGYVERPGVLLPREVLAKRADVQVEVPAPETLAKKADVPLEKPAPLTLAKKADVLVGKPAPSAAVQQPCASIQKFSKTIEVRPE